MVHAQPAQCIRLCSTQVSKFNCLLNVYITSQLIFFTELFHEDCFSIRMYAGFYLPLSIQCFKQCLLTHQNKLQSFTIEKMLRAIHGEIIDLLR